MIRFGRGRWVSLVAAAILLAVSFARASAAVTVTSFTAQAQASQIVLNWKTASEISNAGFNLYRGALPAGPWTKLNPSLIPGCPGCALGSSYSFTDSSVAKGQTYYYRLESVEFSGATQPFGPVPAQISVPTATPTPSPTRTSTPLATVTNTAVPGTPTATVYSSPTPFGTPPPTETQFPTRVAFIVGQPTLTPGIVKSAPPKQIAPVLAPEQSVEIVPPVVVAANPSSTDSSGDPDNASNAPPVRTLPSPLSLALFGVASLFAVSALAFGAVSLYFLARRFVR